MEFERGIDPKEALRIGGNRPKKKGDVFIAFCRDFNKEIEVIAIDDESNLSLQPDNDEQRYISVEFKKGGHRSVAHSNWDYLGEWITYI